MPTNFPQSLDDFPNLPEEQVGSPVNLRNAIANLNDAVEALQAKLTADPHGLTNLVSDGEPTAEAKAALTTSLAGDDNDLVWTSKLVGNDGNQTTIEYLDPQAVDQSLAITVDGYAITVSLETDGNGDIATTADDIKTELGNVAAADALVSAADAGEDDGSGVVTAMAATALEGGTDALGRGVAKLGSICVDYDTPALYINTGTTDEPVWELYPGL